MPFPHRHSDWGKKDEKDERKERRGPRYEPNDEVFEDMAGYTRSKKDEKLVSRHKRR